MINSNHLRNWINRNSKLLHSYDVNNDGNISDLEITTIYSILYQYLQLDDDTLWFFKNSPKNGGPVFLSKVPESTYTQVRPMTDEAWIPLSLLKFAKSELQQQESKIRALPSHYQSKQQLQKNQTILLSTTESLVGYEITQNLGLVWGVSTRSHNLFSSFVTRFKSFFGGELDSYTQLAIDTRLVALDRLIAAALRKDANAIIRLVFDNSGAPHGGSEVVAYGTAIRVRKK